MHTVARLAETSDTVAITRALAVGVDSNGEEHLSWNALVLYILSTLYPV